MALTALTTHQLKPCTQMAQTQTPEEREQASKICCLTGYLFSGKATGFEATIAGFKTYVASPAQPTTKCVLLITDVFGYTLPNTRILADKYAAAGFLAIIPDFLGSDAVAPDAADVFDAPAECIWGKIAQGLCGNNAFFFNTTK